MPVYHLNADFDYREMQDFTRLDPDCVHTTLPTPLTMPEQVLSYVILCFLAAFALLHSIFQVTLCVRTKVKTFNNPVKEPYAFGVYFGSLLPV